MNLGPGEEEKVYAVIRNMLAALGDPYTRFLTPAQYESLTAYAKGTTTSSSSSGGIGVQLMPDPANTGRVMVATTIPDSPAAKSGILPGDVIFQVDDFDAEGATPEVVAATCRGDSGTPVRLSIRHVRDDGKLDDAITKISVQRAQIKTNNSVESSMFVSETGKKMELIKVSSFTPNTAQKVMDAMKEIQRSAASAVVIDLRGNVGGYMPAGVDVAKLFLPPQARVITEVDKSGRATIYINDGVGSETTIAVYVLVDARTASASEILTAALQDNHRATIVGATRTFGKGRIQNVQEVGGNGSGIAVTKAKYMTPEGRDIHGIGITPDVLSTTCGPNDGPAACLKGIL
jgi:carboxyl-terminal processing protease